MLVLILPSPEESKKTFCYGVFSVFQPGFPANYWLVVYQ